MKEMINKYLIPTSNAGMKKIIVKPDEHYFDKIVMFHDKFTYRPKQREKLQRSYKTSIEMGCQNTMQRLILIFSIRKYRMKYCLHCLQMYKLEWCANQIIPKKHSVPSPVLFSSSKEPQIHFVETATNNIIYPRLIFNLDHLTSTRDLLNLPVLLYIMNNVDTERYSVDEMEILGSECSSGIRMGVSCYNQFGGDNTKYRNVYKEELFQEQYVRVGTSLLMQNNNLEKVTSLIQAKLQNHQLSRSLDRIQVLLQSLLASSHMEISDNMPLYNVRRNSARFSMTGFIDDCYVGYQHV